MGAFFLKILLALESQLQTSQLEAKQLQSRIDILLKQLKGLEGSNQEFQEQSRRLEKEVNRCQNDLLQKETIIQDLLQSSEIRLVTSPQSQSSSSRLPNAFESLSPSDDTSHSQPKRIRSPVSLPPLPTEGISLGSESLFDKKLKQQLLDTKIQLTRFDEHIRVQSQALHSFIPVKSERE